MMYDAGCNDVFEQLAPIGHDRSPIRSGQNLVRLDVDLLETR